ncbi:WecB/TagA/CpsF family glycosyltransferase [Halioxenophilus aromaticivorans]|uniref:WecB/TagA/CpsF family glycosyltransferase n=1 Tax=Halioxenophilus aromaticivorans TaxID=1306992 RepID=A0AAV3U116_9ALTE
MKPRNNPTPYEQLPMLNAAVDNISMRELLMEFNEGMLLTLNVEMLAKLQYDREFYDLLPQFDYITCDSQIMYFYAKLVGMPIKERVSGSDFFPVFYNHYKDNPDVSVFICGGAEGVAETARQNVNAKVGREFVVGTSSPPMAFERNPEELDKVIDAINASGATVLMVALGSARQEKFMFQIRSRVPKVKMFLPLGGTVDYEAGTFPRPSPWVTNAGLEWLYRLVKEPKKRFKRYVIQQPPVLWLLLKQRLGIYRDPLDDGEVTREAS